MHSPAVNSNPNSTFPHIFPPTTTSLQPAAPIYPATTPSASTSRAHPFGAPSNSSARLLPPPTLTLDRPSQPHSMSTTQPQALSSTLHSPQSSPPRRAFQHALQSSPPRRSFSLAASSNVSRRGDAPTRNGVGGHARAVSLTSHQLPGSSGAAPGPSRLPRLTTTSRPTPSPLSSVSNVGMQSNFNGSGSALNSASSGSGSALNSAVSGSGSRSTGSPNHSSNASPVQPNTSPLQFNNGNTPALIVNKRRRAHLFLHRKRSMSVEEVAVPKIHGEYMPRPSLGDVGQSRPSFGDVRRHRYGDGDESRPSSSASNRPPPAGLGSASGLRRPRMITERVASSSAMDRLGPSNSDRPPAMEWLGPRTVKAFAAAGLLDESDPRTRDNGGHFDKDRELAKERERQQHRDHDAPSRTTFSEAGSSVSASWGARMRNPHPPSHPRSMTPSSSVYPRSMTPSTSAHTRCMTPSTRTGTMSPSNTNVSPTFSFSAARTHSGSSAPTSVSYGSGYAAGNPPTREIRAQHPNTAPPSQASSHSHSTHSSSHTAAETAGQSRNRTLVSNQIEAQVSLLKEKHEVETGALLGALSDSQRTTKALREENFTLRGENYALKEEIGVLKGDNGMLRDEGKALKARVGALVEELEGMRRELEDLGGEVERLRLGEGARVRVEGWDRSQQKNNMAQSTSRYRSSSLSSRIQGSPSLRRPYLPRSRSQLHQMTLGDDNAGAWGGSKEEDVDVDDSRNHHFDGHKFDGDRRKRGQDSHQSNWEESANTWDNRRISWDEDRQGWGADDQDHNTENQSIQYTRRRASTTSSISIFPNLPTNMSMLMHEPASPMFGLRTGSNGDVKRNHEKQAQWSRSNSSGSGNESRSGSPAMDNTVGEFGRQLTPGCVHSSSKTTSAHVSTPASNSIYSSTAYDSTLTYTSMSANIPISSPDNSRSPANISPTTANFSMTEMTGSPGSLQLRPEHELHLGDMASLSLYAMSDGEEGDFEL
ncbi:hypothetical protein BJ138DRAFT_1155144 [Hygrophoropsis aurantiaca]|uniref:Uncharacterized protein n=1 Tax=Hygrophoropsis aurantiaca TaxID=72124 RepID=A0ACB8A8T0_9AGAM|nr:hypothetical protein BJ138DRAFT_1155144 [Hygrophoropsis aurantiaca]